MVGFAHSKWQKGERGKEGVEAKGEVGAHVKYKHVRFFFVVG